jgi:2-polyprenyl-6-methoxyphenol hydroxylase-like FAD-dependent oxidoreductase
MSAATGGAVASGQRAHAVVMGGSVAGMVAARVLSDHFQHVTIVERDRLPAEPDHRPGVPQSFQAHQLIAGGRQVLERLFPGLDDTLAAAGAPLIDLVNDARLHFAPGVLARGPSGAKLRSITRIRLEWEVRKRLGEVPNVSIVQNAGAVGLLSTPDRTRVTGVRLERAVPAGGDVPGHLDADLVVDATGRRSRAADWLTALGYDRPSVNVVDGHVSYATRLYEEIPLPEGTGMLWTIARAPDNPRFGLIFPVEGGRSLALVGGIGKDCRAPTEDKAFLEFSRSLIDPMIHEHLRTARPLTRAQAYRQLDNQWRHYETIARMPERFVPLGDSVCAFNPVYGQGMTVAALEGTALGDELATGGLEGLAARAQRRFSKIIAPAWLFATGEDYRWSTTDGPPVPRLARIAHAYIDHVILLALGDPKVAALLVEVGQMAKPFNVLFSPRLLVRVLGRILSGRRRLPARRPAEVSAAAFAAPADDETRETSTG